MRRLDLSIRQRLAIGFSIVLVLIAAEIVFSVVETNRAHHAADALVQDIDPKLALTRDLRVAYLKQAIALRGFAISPDDEREQQFRAAAAEADAAARELDRRALDADERRLLSAAEALRVAYAERAEALLSGARTGAENLGALEADVSSAREALIAPLDELVRLEDGRAADARQRIDDARQVGLRAQVVLGLFTVAAIGVTAFVTALAVRRPAERLVDASRALGAGEFASALALLPAPAGGERHRYRDELRELAETFRRMVQDIMVRSARTQSSGRIATILASSLEIERLASGTLREVADFAQCEVGIVYRHDENAGTLVPVRAMGFADEFAQPIAIDEGVPGRAARDRAAVVVRDLPGDTPFQVGLGFDRLPARTVVAVPMAAGEKLIGVLLVASVREIPPDTLTFIETVGRRLAVALQNAIAHAEIRTLLTQLREQNEELQAQNEEIQAQNDEIVRQREEIQTQNEELQVQNEELNAQRLALIEADRHKDEFLSIAVHELRGPITGIKGSAQLMRRATRTKPELAELDAKLEAIDRLSNTLVVRINRLLDVTRARMGTLAINPAPLDLVGLARDCVEDWRSRTPGREIVLTTEHERTIGSWDRAAMLQVLDNLVENALRYSPEGGPVHVSIASDGKTATLSVADSGIGIPKEAIPRLFELYYREPNATRVTGEGLGLGLYITNQLVRAHGGEINVSSTVGAGTIFEVSLPLQVPAGQSAPVA